MVTAAPLDHALTSLVEIESGKKSPAKKPVQMSMFDAVETGKNAIATETVGKPDKKPAKKSKVSYSQVRDYGSGVTELNLLNRRPMKFEELTTEKKLGYLAHRAYERVMHVFVSRERPDYIASGLTFAEWFAGKKSILADDYAKWRAIYGWIPGWWNFNPTGQEPEDLDAALKYVMMFERGNNG